MKQLTKFFLAVFAVLVISQNLYSQSCNTMNIQWQSDIASGCSQMTMTMMHDAMGRPYLYVANKEAGLKVYDITSLNAPLIVASVSISSFDSLQVMNLTQDSTYLFLAVGNHFNNIQESGMAIVDVSNPAIPVVTDYWELPSSTGGAGIVKVEGNYAYLGAMGNGLVILDVTNKNNIQFVSQFIPDINYPVPSPANPATFNARGMEVKNDIVYLCYDAGGIRIINTVNKLIPVETGRYSNPVMNPVARAYNNVVLDDSLLYVSVDYCGLEVLNVSDTSNITLTGAWNPYGCPTNNWFSSPVHANEIQYNKNCHEIFLSTGKSDLHVIDVSNPSLPDSCNYYGGVSNGIGTWGVGLFQNQIYLSYICTLGIPFTSNWTGVKILTYTECPTGIDEQSAAGIKVFPVPSGNYVWVETGKYFSGTGKIKLTLTNTLGQILKTQNNLSGKNNIDVSDLSDGIYFLTLAGDSRQFQTKIIKSSLQK
jgi:hypothetical protein